MLGSSAKYNPFFDILIVKMSFLSWKNYTSELLKLQKFEGDTACMDDYERELVYSTNSSFSGSGSVSKSESKSKGDSDDSDSESK